MRSIGERYFFSSLSQPMAALGYFVLGGDIGGTTTRLQLYRVECPNGAIEMQPGHNPPGTQVYGKKYQNCKFDNFDDIIRQFFVDLTTDPKVGLAMSPSEVTVACLAVAGPVTKNSVTFTNRNWVLSGEDLSKTLGIPGVELINDFVAQGYGLLSLNVHTECVCLHAASRNTDAPIACIGAGTGLGECFLTPGPAGYVCFPSEGGHAEYAPRQERDIKMLAFLQHKYESTHRISVERVVSGPGIANIYSFLETHEPEKIDPVVHAAFTASEDLQSKVVADNIATCDLCKDSIEVFLEAYGSEAGVAGLKWMPFGGLYLTGGLTPKFLDRIRDPDGPFMRAYFDKGRVSPLLQDVPLYAVKAEDLGERGAHWKAVAMLRQQLQVGAPTVPIAPPSRALSRELSAALAFLGGLAIGALLLGRPRP